MRFRPLTARFLPLLLLLASAATGAAPVEQDLIRLRSQYAEQIARTNGNPAPIILETRRFFTESEWRAAYLKNPLAPWKAVPDATWVDWGNALNWVESLGSSLEPTAENLKTIHRLAMKSAYYRGYELRRVQAKARAGELDPKIADQQIQDIQGSEHPKTYSGTDHADLGGKFRSDPLDHFVTHGDNVDTKHRRYFRGEELFRMEIDPYFKIEAGSVSTRGADQYAGQVHMVAPHEVDALTERSLADCRNSLAQAKTWTDRLAAIARLENDLMKIHPFLDGNGRSIRILIDGLHAKYGFPPRLYYADGDFYLNASEQFAEDVEHMKRYVDELIRDTPAHPKTAPPKNLFSWASQRRLQRLADTHAGSPHVPLDTILENELIAVAFPELKDTPGLYAWTNPMSAMMSDKSEIYAASYKGAPARVMLLRPKPDAKVVEIHSWPDQPPIPWSRKAREADLIFHVRHGEDGRVFFREWLVRNPEAIAEFTADPALISPALRTELERQSARGFVLPEEERHFPTQGKAERNLQKKLVQEYLSASSEGIPAAWMRPISPDGFEPPSTDCTVSPESWLNRLLKPFGPKH